MGLGLHRQQTTDAGADDHADAIGVGVGDFEACIGKGLLGGHHAEFAEAVPALGFLRFDQPRWVKRLHFRRKPTGVGRCVEERDGGDPVAAGCQAAPVLHPCCRSV